MLAELPPELEPALGCREQKCLARAFSRCPVGFKGWRLRQLGSTFLAHSTGTEKCCIFPALETWRACNAV
eukprot:3000000-Lingulodinium_polyedra.AAC.1